MMEPLAVAWHGVKRSGFQPGDKCLVLGSGPVSATTIRRSLPELTVTHSQIGLMVLKVLRYAVSGYPCSRVATYLPVYRQGPWSRMGRSVRALDGPSQDG